MIGLIIVYYILNNLYDGISVHVILPLLFLISIIFTFVVSIIHLNRHRKKSFAVVSLVFSSIFMLLILVVGIGSSDSNTIFIRETNKDIQKEYFQSYPFNLNIPGYLNLNYSSDFDSNLYILESNEYNRYANGEDFHYLEKAENSKLYSFEDSYFPTGTYYVVIKGVNSSIRYNLSVDGYPA